MLTPTAVGAAAGTVMAIIEQLLRRRRKDFGLPRGLGCIEAIHRSPGFDYILFEIGFTKASLRIAAVAARSLPWLFHTAVEAFHLGCSWCKPFDSKSLAPSDYTLAIEERSFSS